MSLTAELEKIEQKITLTLQEIDHNFARAHRIVTTSILPIVDRYGKESEAVWEGSKFWKQFFEASANVALSNYQEEAVFDEDQTVDGDRARHEHTYGEDATSMASSPGHYTAGEPTVNDDDFTRDQRTQHSGIHGGVGSGDDDDDLLEDSLLESLNLTTGGAMQSTPKPVPARGRAQAQETEWADMESPFDALAKELTMKYGSPERPQQQQRQQRYGASASSVGSSSMLPPPTTPRTTRYADAETLESSPFRAPPVARTPGIANDRVMHRVLDKNWRIQATPLRSAMKSRYRTVAATPRQPPVFVKNVDDSSPMSSPPEPQLQTQIFTPGVLRTPGAKRLDAATATRGATGGDVAAREAASKYMYDDDSDDDLLLPPGFSPPKTMQFSLPASKLMATPAREASKRIVRDILQTAGASVDSTLTTDASSPIRGGMDDDDDDPF